MSDPAPVGLDAAGLDPALQGADVGGGAPPAAAPPDPGATAGLSNEALANIDAGVAVPDNTQIPDQGAALQDPAVAELLDALQQGDPQAMQILDLAARRRMAGA